MTFLNKSKTVDTPTDGTFTPFGMVSLWNAAMMYTLFSQSPLPDEFKNKGIVAAPRGSGYWFYSADKEAMEELRQALGLEYEANLVWHFETRSADVLNFTDETRQKFGEVISYDVSVKSLFSTKRRHEYQLIALPAAVAAYADWVGYENAGFDLSELLDQNTIYDDPFHFRMIGNPDHKNGDAEHYENSVLWQRRVQLWASLGEENPKAYKLIGAGTRFDATSEKFSECSGIANYEWDSPQWMKIVTVNDPRMDATYNENRLNIPVIFKIYNNREEAMADVESVQGQSSGSTLPAASSAPTSTASGLAVPEAWKELADDCPQYLREFKAKNPSLIPPVITKATAELQVTEQELRAWWDQV